MKLSKTLFYLLTVCLIALLAVSCGNGDQTEGTTDAISNKVIYPGDTSVRVIEILRPSGSTASSASSSSVSSSSITTVSTTKKTTLTTTTATYLRTTVVIGSDPQNPLSVPITFENVMEENAKIGLGSLVLYNASNKQKNNSYIDSLIPIYGNRKANYQLANTSLALMPEVVDALNEMAGAINTQLNRSDLLVRSAYRTPEQQLALYEAAKNTYGANVDRYVLPPDCSDYRTGYALYFQIIIEGVSYELDHTRAKSIKQWLDENASGYGFVVRYPAGKSASTNINEGVELHHYRYVGRPHSIIMNQLGYSLEEYVEYLKQYTYSGKHLCVSAEEGNYQIYYIASGTDLTAKSEIYLPVNYEYTISGDNAGGYIVTVNTSKPVTGQ